MSHDSRYGQYELVSNTSAVPRSGCQVVLKQARTREDIDKNGKFLGHTHTKISGQPLTVPTPSSLLDSRPTNSQIPGYINRKPKAKFEERDEHGTGTPNFNNTDRNLDNIGNVQGEANQFFSAHSQTSIRNIQNASELVARPGAENRQNKPQRDDEESIAENDE